MPFLRSNAQFEFNGASYTVHLRSRSGDPARPNEDDAEPATQVTVTMNLRGGMIRDYEVKLEGASRDNRARITVPVSEQRIVVITYVPVTRIDIPSEAREKLAAAARPSGSRP